MASRDIATPPAALWTTIRWARTAISMTSARRSARRTAWSVHSVPARSRRWWPCAELGEALRQVHQHFADTLAELLRRDQSAGDIRGDVDPHTTAWWLVSPGSGSFRAAVVPGRDAVEAELTGMAAGSYLTCHAGRVAAWSRYSRGPRRK